MLGYANTTYIQSVLFLCTEGVHVVACCRLLDTPHVGDLLRAMIAAEDPINPTRPKRHADARQGASSAAPKVLLSDSCTFCSRYLQEGHSCRFYVCTHTGLSATTSK